MKDKLEEKYTCIFKCTRVEKNKGLCGCHNKRKQIWESGNHLDKSGVRVIDFLKDMDNEDK